MRTWVDSWHVTIDEAVRGVKRVKRHDANGRDSNKILKKDCGEVRDIYVRVIDLMLVLKRACVEFIMLQQLIKLLWLG